MPLLDWEGLEAENDMERQIYRLHVLHDAGQDLVWKLARRDRIIKLTVMASTVLTGGGLWVLIGSGWPETAGWVGAILSTLVALLMGVDKISKYGERASRAATVVWKTKEVLIGLKHRKDEDKEETAEWFWGATEWIQQELLELETMIESHDKAQRDVKDTILIRKMQGKTDS